MRLYCRCPLANHCMTDFNWSTTKTKTLQTLFDENLKTQGMVIHTMKVIYHHLVTP